MNKINKAMLLFCCAFGSNVFGMLGKYPSIPLSSVIGLSSKVRWIKVTPTTGKPCKEEYEQALRKNEQLYLDKLTHLENASTTKWGGEFKNAESALYNDYLAAQEKIKVTYQAETGKIWE